VSDLKALHEAATPAPWGSTPAIYADGDKGIDIIPPDWPENGPDVAERCSVPDAAFIVALRNAYADGTLVERTPVGGERMSECIRPHLRDCPTCAYNGRCDAQDATSIERKPLDGYDWRADIEVVRYTKRDSARGFAAIDDAALRLAAHIESLEAERDWLARWCALYATAPGKSATMTLNECGEQQVAAWLAAAAIARVKGGTK
jgi:hypothetical protein